MGSKPKQLGLDDPKRVRKLLYRGEELSHDQAKLGRQCVSFRTQRPVLSDELGRLLEDLAYELDYAKIPCGLDPDNKSYIPRGKLQDILTPMKVRQLVRGLSPLDDQSKGDALANKIYYGSKTPPTPPSLKLLAVLIAIDKFKYINEHMADGLNDACLPLTRRTGDSGSARLFCRYHGREHRIVNEYRRADDRQRFSTWSYSLSAPFIKCPGDKHSHYVLDAGDVFPMKVVRKIDKKEPIKGLDPDFMRASMPAINKYGGFSDVYQITIDRNNYDFGNFGLRHPEGLFALKKLTSHDRESFNLELASLLFSMDKYSVRKSSKHLIQLLATFEVHNPRVEGPSYYLLFDWAEGTLKDFWKKNQRFVRRLDHCRWMARQFHELCEALQCVHNERGQTLRSLNSADFDQDLYGRHGDIKPDNFLWFRPRPENRSDNDEPDLLALSDFGLGRLHTQVSRSKQNPQNIGGTATYRSPEFDVKGGSISRASDVFSLGCVLLEYITWFLRGLEDVESEFPSIRAGQDIHGFEVDTFFEISSDGRRPRLKASVDGWICALRDDPICSLYLRELLDFIKDEMLHPLSDKRIRADLLTRKMYTLRRACETDPDFYLRPVGRH
ncbi:protein kinase [Xylariomycetidae sp. FL2044]|nr:protein kinase [Xylariomycetidae sp. FL2044]